MTALRVKWVSCFLNRFWIVRCALACVQIIATLPRRDANFKEISSNLIDQSFVTCNHENMTCTTASMASLSTGSAIYPYLVVRSSLPAPISAG